MASREGKRRKRRFSPEEGTAKPRVLAPPFIPFHSLTPSQMDCFLLRFRIEEISEKLRSNQLDIPSDPEYRSPSPDPVYDLDTNLRVNTRENRTKDRLKLELEHCVQLAKKANPMFQPPPEYTQVPTYKRKRLMIPIDKYPDYNFIGLILGPRGQSQRELEQVTGAKISIRGKGSSKGIKNKDKMQEGDNLALHVFVMAPTNKALNAACKRLEQMMIPEDDEANAFKQAQLRQLALYNGTLRERTWEEPVVDTSFTKADVVCNHCGEKSHPSRDCPSKNTRVELEYKRKKIKEDEALEELKAMDADPDPEAEAAANALKARVEEFVQSLKKL